MTVKELIEFLKVQPQDAKVVVFAVDCADGYDELDKAELIHMVQFPESHGAEYFTSNPKKKEKTVRVVKLW